MCWSAVHVLVHSSTDLAFEKRRGFIAGPLARGQESRVRPASLWRVWVGSSGEAGEWAVVGGPQHSAFLDSSAFASERVLVTEFLYACPWFWVSLEIRALFVRALAV